jgi:hypothetical protein
MRTFLFLAGALFLHNVAAQIGTGQWRMHVPNRSAIDVIVRGDQVFSAFGNGLLEVDIPSGEKSLWTTVSILSDINITCLGMDGSKQYVFVGYDNGNIDKIDGSTVINIPSIRLAQIQGNKRINKIVPYGDFVYLATGFSVIKLDPLKDEVKETFYPTADGTGILDIAFKGDSIFAMTENRLLRAKLSNFALADPNQWQEDTRIPVLSSNSYGGLEIIDDLLFVHFKHSDYGKDTVFRITETGSVNYATDNSLDIEVNSIATENNNLCIFSDGLITNNGSNGQLLYSFSSYLLGQWISPVNGATKNGTSWIADKTLGLIRMDSEYGFTRFGFEGPAKNEFCSMDWHDGKLAIAGGGISSIANTFSGSGVQLLEEESWKLYDRDNMNLWNGQNIWDFLSVSIDPTNSNRMAVGTYSEIPVSIIENGIQVTDTFTPLNSTLESTPLNSSWSLVSSVQYDEDGNLWALNGFTEKPLNVYTKDGLWYNFDCGSGLGNKFSRKMVIDYQGNKWFSMEGAGLYGYKHGSSIADPSDDQRIFLNTGENSGNLPSKSVTALAVDFDNELWIGTDNGFAVLYNSEGAFGASQGEYDADRIKVQFEGNVEYVLGNTNITDIEVDGGNRKWFATANSGIILLSADGLEIIEQHTTENSPLISNNIIDLELNQQTGELFIVTDKGLVSYRTNATYQDADYSNVTVFPNPLRPEYHGPVTIQGIQYNSDVKITDIAGNLVYKTESNGGTASWNGKNLNGEDVTTGVYLIWTASIDGDGKKVGKVLVVR